MPPRQRDILDRHDNLARRMTALEIGAHPTGSETTYWDTIDLMDVVISGSSRYIAYVSGINDYRPKWQRRIGIVHLQGAVQVQSSHGSSSVIGTLPTDARPLVEQTFLCAVSISPWTSRVTVKTNGDLFVDDDAGMSDGNVLHLDSISFPTA